MPPNFFSQYLVPAGLAVIMFGIGINLHFRDFAHVFRRPKAFVVGIATQLLLLPVLAFLIATPWHLPPAVKAGLVLLAACPGGSSSNLITHLLRGRVALSVAMTALNSLVILVTIPLLTNLALQFYMGAETELRLPFWPTIREIALTILLPTVLGLAFNARFPRTAARLEKPLRYLLPLVLLLIFSGVIFFEEGSQQRLGAARHIILPAFLLNLGGAFAGGLIARVAGLSIRGQFTIAIEVGLQNSALAIFVATKLLQQPDMAMVAVVYSGFTYFTTVLWAYLIKRFF